MSANPFTILPTDTRWPGPYHVEEGPDCLCSRCGQPILEDDIAVRVWPEDANRYSYRFHPACLGMQSAHPLEDETSADADVRYEETLDRGPGQALDPGFRQDGPGEAYDEDMPGMVIWPPEDTP